MNYNELGETVSKNRRKEGYRNTNKKAEEHHALSGLYSGNFR